QDIGGWDVSKVTDMKNMFASVQTFNHNIGSWQVGQVTNMVGMFAYAWKFNQDIGGWDVSNVTNMAGMFFSARAFNQDIGSWDVQQVTSMKNMFFDCPLNQDLGAWNVSNVTDMSDMFGSFGHLSVENYDKLLIGWSTLTLQNGVNFGNYAAFYCNGSDARQQIIDDFGWSIFDAGAKCLDSDNDGVEDSIDVCPNTPIGEEVDETGCPVDQDETDTDGDGIPDMDDTDDDNDGTPDTDDDFPLNPEEDTDTDGDGTGDNADEDDDNDGTPDSDDAFPFDPDEHMDTDGDGIGDNSDTDDDGDGYSDETEQEEGSDPKDASSIPEDSVDEGDDNGDSPGISEPLLVPAQAFTPNGDGNNDAWIIPGIDNYPNNNVRVYNRWGHEVFGTKSYRNNWEGFYKSRNEKLPAGSYLYIIDLGNGSAPLQGWIFINY
ncbi:BspA family leucine-rich repeat surface protein, partial [Muricauda brasiliensis]|uniref:BspA family leucine-rich repeat surface protein n=1 Tax=Muricauda brasiliensis TaxID=2162892 RepID=UPI00131EFD16